MLPSLSARIGPNDYRDMVARKSGSRGHSYFPGFAESLTAKKVAGRVGTAPAGEGEEGLEKHIARFVPRPVARREIHASLPIVTRIKCALTEADVLASVSTPIDDRSLTSHYPQ